MSGYLKQKLFQALHDLVGAGDIDKRLTHAGNYLVHLQEADIPKEYRAEVAAIKEIMFTTPPSSEQGYVPRQISDEDGAKLARRILSLFTDVMGGRRLWIYLLSNEPQTAVTCPPELVRNRLRKLHGTADYDADAYERLLKGEITHFQLPPGKYPGGIRVGRGANGRPPYCSIGPERKENGRSAAEAARNSPCVNEPAPCCKALSKGALLSKRAPS